MTLHPKLQAVTERLEKRSEASRGRYLDRMQAAEESGVHRAALSCGNLAHGFAACDSGDKKDLKGEAKANLAIVSSYNDMLSAHQPFARFPDLIKRVARDNGAVAQFAGGVPAMCDGVTQGQPGMELSLFSRDVIAMATAVSMSHNMFDGALYLGVCDKIVPGLLMGALSFGHLPTAFVPAGPMPSGLSNFEKVRIRQLYAQGKIGRSELLNAESKSYHSPGTCTFYGTANSNQLMMEMMGLHLPGSSFVNPSNPLRDALTEETVKRVLANTPQKGKSVPLYKIVTAKSILNAVIGLLASGGSTNHTIHLMAIARAAGVQLDWTDLSELSEIIPLLARVYPNGQADVNHFHAAGGIGLMMRELVNNGLMHNEVTTIMGDGLEAYFQEPFLDDGKLVWREGPITTQDAEVVGSVEKPFSKDGGLKLMEGNLGRGVIKISAVKEAHQVVHAPARVFDSQNAMMDAFKAGELEGDMVAVVRFQGPKANGMPELHKLTPPLGVLQDKGFKVALVTDGRMSGASGKVPAAIHVTPEVLDGGPLGKIRDGDMILLDAKQGILRAEVDEATWAAREQPEADLSGNEWGMGRDLFSPMRMAVNGAEAGATVFRY